MTDVPVSSLGVRLRERDGQSLRFIAQYVQTNGYPPTIREVARELNVSSTSTAQQSVERLVRRGWISISSKSARTMRITPEGMSEIS